MQWAASYGQEKSISLLLDAGCDPSAVNSKGWSALHYAAFNGQLECLRLLLKSGADYTTKNEAGYTALDLAATQEISYELETHHNWLQRKEFLSFMNSFKLAQDAIPQELYTPPTKHQNKILENSDLVRYLLDYI
jgi:hypothetical protein